MSRKLPKETIYFAAIALLQLFCGISSWASPAILTTQRTIVIDPGHGGKDSGVQVSADRSEKDICLTLALGIADRMNERYNTRLTRTDDRGLPAEKRVALTNQSRASLFISIHLHTRQQTRGLIYYFESPTPNTDPPTAWQSAPLLHQAGSRTLAKTIQDAFSPVDQHYFTIQGAALPILEGTLMPAILIEVFPASDFPGNLSERETYLDNIAHRITLGITRYLQTTADD